MILKFSFWVTILFLFSVILVWGASLFEIVPALEEIGVSSFGIGLTVFWLIGLIAMIVNVIAMIYAMLRAKKWLWALSSFFLAPFTTLYYYWFIYRKKSI